MAEVWSKTILLRFLNFGPFPNEGKWDNLWTSRGGSQVNFCPRARLKARGIFRRQAACMASQNEFGTTKLETVLMFLDNFFKLTSVRTSFIVVTHTFTHYS